MQCLPYIYSPQPVLTSVAFTGVGHHILGSAILGSADMLGSVSLTDLSHTGVGVTGLGLLLGSATGVGRGFAYWPRPRPVGGPGVCSSVRPLKAGLPPARTKAKRPMAPTDAPLGHKQKRVILECGPRRSSQTERSVLSGVAVLRPACPDRHAAWLSQNSERGLIDGLTEFLCL